jgi:hypothetical protein
MKSLLIAAAAASLIAAGADRELVDLTVHEWGTFTSVAGEDGSSIEWDALGCNDLPRFVHYFGYRQFKWQLRGTVRMETPVMYFYSPSELDAHVKVLFPQGVITEWYPQAEPQVYQASSVGGSPQRLAPSLYGIDTSLKRVTGAIEWNSVKVQPDTTPQLPVESGTNRYYAARGTDAAPVTVSGQHEKFLFYRGVGEFQPPLTARVSPDGTVVVGNRGRDEVPALFLFENSRGRRGYRRADVLRDTVTLYPPALDGSTLQLTQELEATLVRQGLFPREARAMVETWRDSWFEEGARLIYILPARAVDTMLPLQVEPAPSNTTRVFVGRIELVTPEILDSAESAIGRNDRAALDRYGRFLDTILARVFARNPSGARQVDQLRGKLQACDAF